MGDFNDILHADEKKGMATRPNWLIRGFRKAVQDAGLIDVHMDIPLLGLRVWILLML